MPCRVLCFMNHQDSYGRLPVVSPNLPVDALSWTPPENGWFPCGLPLERPQVSKGTLKPQTPRVS